MLLAVDIGASKTLLAIFSVEGQVKHQKKIRTPADYSTFLHELNRIIDTEFKAYEIKQCCCAIPGLVDRRRGEGLSFGNLKWRNVPIKKDLSAIIKAPVIIENDAKLAGLSEAILIQKKYNNVLYLTIGTGIGDAIIINGKIDPNLADSEAGQMVVEHEGKLIRWEDIASGKALKQKYGQLASEINDPAIWRQFAANLALGIGELVAVLRPEVIIIGGGVGAHFEKFAKLLAEELKKFENQMVKMPPLLKAKRPEEAVIYGCFDFIRHKT